MHVPATLQNGLARKLAGVSRSLKPTKWFAGIAAPFVVALAALIIAGMAQVSLPGLAEAHDPNIPQGLTATSGDGDITLMWNTATNANAGYEYRYTENQNDLFFGTAPAWHQATTASGTTTFIHGDDSGEEKLTVGTTYYFQVRSKHAAHDSNEIQYSGPSDMAIAVQRAAPPAVPNLAAVAGNAKVTLTWDDFDLDYLIGNYQYRQNSGGVWSSWTTTISYTKDESADPDTFTLEIGDLTNGTSYSFQVRATNNIGEGDDKTKEGPDGSTVSATPSGAPAAPDLRATPGDGNVRLRWADLGDATITKFQYRKRLTSGEADAWDPNWEDIAGSSATTTEHTAGGLTNTNEYTFEVRAINDQGNGAEASVTATPTTAARTPSLISNLTATVTGVSDGKGGTVTFTWDDPEEGFINEYQYRYSSTSNIEGFTGWTKILNSDASMITWAPGIHGSSANVFYELRAVNTTPSSDLEGPLTAIRVERTNAADTSDNPPVAPMGLTAAPGVQQVTLTWTVSSAAIQGYQVRQSTDGGTNFDAWAEKFGEATTDTHTVTDLTDGTTYTFELRMVAGTAEAPIYGAAAQA